MKISFSPPDIGQAEIDNVTEVLKSGWITTGPKTKEFETRIAKYCSTPNAICLNSQTACAETLLRILGIGKGDEVITTSYTYTATASVIYHVGAKAVLIDLGENGLEMDYDKMEKAINRRTKAIIAVDVAGVPCDYDRIYSAVLKKKKLFHPKNDIQKAIGRVIVISDSAHSFGAERKGKKAGNLADFSAFSFHAVKNLTTGEGGALTWRGDLKLNNQEIYKKAQLLSLHGQTKDALSKSQIGQWEYDVVDTFYKCNMTDIMASIGLAQLDRYEGILKRRREIIEKYDKAFIPLGIQPLLHYGEDYSSSGHLYITRVMGITAQTRNKIIQKMVEAGIPCNVHYKPLPLLSAYKNKGFDIKNFPVAHAKYLNEITLPLHTLLTDEEVDYIIENFSRIVKEFI